MTIPADYFVNVNPSVLSSGGNPLALNGVVLSKNTLLPTGKVNSFSSSDAVSDFFGATSDEYNASLVYFAGYENSTMKPSTLFFAPYVGAARAAWLQSGSVAALTLAQLTALSGTLIVTVDGAVFTSSSINLSTASSFSDAATKITAGFTGAGKPTCTYNAVNHTFVLTSPTTDVLSTMTYSTGTLADGLYFTSATGAVLSQGADVDTPATAMANVLLNTHNWATFTTMFEPLIADKEAFAVWVGNQNYKYAYVCWDSDAQAIVNGSTTCFGAVAKALEYEGVLVVYNTLALGMFALGFAASLDFARLNARATFAYKSQSGFVSTCANLQQATNLIANGYSFYGAVATANDQFNFSYDGAMAGKFLWFDTYLNQIYLNAQLQLALVTLLMSIPSLPYVQSGYNLIRASMADPINQLLNFGGIRAGVSLSSAQKAEINNASGVDAASVIVNQGWFLQVLDPGAQVRGNRGTPVINFWYTDGGAIHKITVASIDVL